MQLMSIRYIIEYHVILAIYQRNTHSLTNCHLHKRDATH